MAGIPKNGMTLVGMGRDLERVLTSRRCVPP
jgi:hypothetical protein